MPKLLIVPLRKKQLHEYLKCGSNLNNNIVILMRPKKILNLKSMLSHFRFVNLSTGVKIFIGLAPFIILKMRTVFFTTLKSISIVNVKIRKYKLFLLSSSFLMCPVLSQDRGKEIYFEDGL